FGLLYKAGAWFIRPIGIKSKEKAPLKRVFAAAKGILVTLFSKRILTLLKSFILDVILQRRIIRENFIRWLMHLFIFVGFMMLVFMHALDKLITSKLFPDYYSTINPFMFLRDLFGILVVIGLLIAVYRRFIKRVPRLSTNAMDLYVLLLLAVIMISGIILEGIKITSYTRYKQMVEQYTAAAEAEELRGLEAYWVKEFSVISPHGRDYIDTANLKLGMEIHNMSCVDCHSRPKWAFAGYAVAKAIKPVAGSLDRSGASEILLYIHFLAVFLGLAYLPFSKMFHIVAAPISLVVNEVMGNGKSDAAVATRQIIELDACTHCGTCSLRCSVLAAYETIGNKNILPSEKIQYIKALVR
ncbi:respiratory nitrate reductase subunit gamma, partial [bacterium]|nr:respiratory nitrate reductase subunit gamma [bacterium]